MADSLLPIIFYTSRTTFVRLQNVLASIFLIFFTSRTTSVHFDRIVGTEHAKNYFTLTQNGFSTLAWISMRAQNQNGFVFVLSLFVTPTLADYLQLSCGGYGTITHEQLI